MEKFKNSDQVGLGPTLSESQKDLQNEENMLGQPFTNNQQNLYSDGTLQILTNTENLNYNIVFKDMFPTSLSDMEFDSTDTDVQYFSATVTFKYSIYIINNRFNKRVWPLTLAWLNQCGRKIPKLILTTYMKNH